MCGENRGIFQIRKEGGHKSLMLILEKILLKHSGEATKVPDAQNVQGDVQKYQCLSLRKFCMHQCIVKSPLMLHTQLALRAA